jgi:hypothetical protein
MQVEKRRTPRRPIRRPAFIDVGDGSMLRGCMLRDISAGGARVVVETATALPEEFSLMLGHDGRPPRRRCRVVWRFNNVVGVEFLNDPSEVDKDTSTAENAEMAVDDACATEVAFVP